MFVRRLMLLCLVLVAGACALVVEPAGALGKTVAHVASRPGMAAAGHLALRLRPAGRVPCADGGFGTVAECASQEFQKWEHQTAHDWYEACSQGVRPWEKATGYKGSEGLKNLPGQYDQYGKDTIGFRTGAEADKGAPAIDFNIDGRSFKIHFIH